MCSHDLCARTFRQDVDSADCHTGKGGVGRRPLVTPRGGEHCKRNSRWLWRGPINLAIGQPRMCPCLCSASRSVRITRHASPALRCGVLRRRFRSPASIGFSPLSLRTAFSSILPPTPWSHRAVRRSLEASSAIRCPTRIATTERFFLGRLDTPIENVEDAYRPGIQPPERAARRDRSNQRATNDPWVALLCSRA